MKLQNLGKLTLPFVAAYLGANIIGYFAQRIRLDDVFDPTTRAVYAINDEPRGLPEKVVNTLFPGARVARYHILEGCKTEGVDIQKAEEKARENPQRVSGSSFLEE